MFKVPSDLSGNLGMDNSVKLRYAMPFQVFGKKFKNSKIALILKHFGDKINFCSFEKFLCYK
jgi:hypothetical protein